MRTASTALARSWRSIYFNVGTIPFWGVHVGAIAGVIALGWSWTGLWWALGAYALRLFFVTGGYHRYFSHRSYRTSRPFQFLLALGGTTTSQKGVLWWAAHHRRHHQASDTELDLHSPLHGGFWWSHVGWILSSEFDETDHDRIKDFARYPELRWLNRLWVLPVVGLAVACLAIGGWFGLVWAFAVPQVLSWHGTFTINSLSHVWGGRRYPSGDDSRNNPALALITLGEGWHNNHHHYQVAARQGFFWWEVDITFYVLRALSAVGLVWDLHGVPDHIRAGRRKKDHVPAPRPLAPGAAGAAAAAVVVATTVRTPRPQPSEAATPASAVDSADAGTPPAP